jgi:hypothetical protein
MTKGEILYKDMKALGEIGHGHGQRGSKIKECEGIKIGSKFLDNRSTQVGEQAHEHD